jgi:hypothetical protein
MNPSASARQTVVSVWVGVGLLRARGAGAIVAELMLAGMGGLLVTVNWRDFAALREELPIQVESLDVFTTRFAHDA